ncbi:hypothetical protein H6G91_35730 [Nostoc muscorum FACHB-395]|nr:hypothetical protein [Desmonostoc muscorum FACHB-395]
MKNFRTLPNHSHQAHFPWEQINTQDLLTDFLKNGGFAGDSGFSLTPKASQVTTSVVSAENLQIDSSSGDSLLEIQGIVDQALHDTCNYLSQFRFDAGYTEKLETAFGKNFNQYLANQLFDDFALGDFSNIPSIEIVNRNDINGANGAFSITTDKIYLASEFISQNSQNLNAIVAVLLEEYGHNVNSKINTTDAAGDEGDIFARLVQGKNISQQDLAILKAEDDTATVTLDGEIVEIEQNALTTSQFITLLKPTSPSSAVIGYGSTQEDILQLQSYRSTTPGLVQKVWGYDGADIFNVNFELPGNGKVGIDFNTWNLKKLAQMLVEPDWDVRNKRIAMDVNQAIVGSAIDWSATAVKAGLFFDITGTGQSIVDAAATAAHLTIELANIAENAKLDLEEYNNNLAAIDKFFADQNNSNWGSVSILDARTVVEIRDFQPGVDIITLPELPTNWTWEVGSGTFSDTAKDYVSIGFVNGSNASGEILRIGFNDYSSSLIIGSKQDLISNLLTTSANSGWVISDTIKEQKIASDSILNGTIANDVLSILATNSFPTVTLSGGLGDDVLISRTNGNDVLNGGDGNDYIVLQKVSDTIYGGIGYDRVDYSNLTAGVNVTSSSFKSIEGVIGTKYSDVIDLRILIDSNSDYLVTGLISIQGNDGNDNLTGSNYNDLLDGGAGNDILAGRQGNDTYIVDNPNDTITENINEGIDSVKSSSTYILGNNLETLTLTGGTAINGTGNAANNVIIGNAVSNILNGGGGDDTLDGGSGNDTLDGGTDNDIYVVNTTTVIITENINEGIDTIQSSVTFSLANLPNVENVTLTGTAAINGTGNTANNFITGNSGNNTLDGGAGNDILAGRQGNDTYIVDNPNDTITENIDEGIDSVKSSFTYILGNNLENLTLTGETAINGTGNAANNVIIGNAVSNILNGGGGDDTLDGGSGNDTLDGGTDNDIYVVNTTTVIITENINEGIDTIQSSVTFSLANLPNVENVTLTGTAAINGTGNTANNFITGNSGNNTLDGSAGNDTLDGGGGIDTLIGDAGNDIYIIDTTTDTITENANEGTDTIQSSVTFSLAVLANIENLTLTGTAAINGTGNTAGNFITGNSGNNTLDGGGGIDTLIGGAGNDIYIIDTITDTITENANEGTDTIQSSVTFSLAALANIENLTLTGTAAINGTGNTANNFITANAGNNILDGGAGNDILNPGYSQGSVDTVNGGDGTDTLEASYINKTDGAGIHVGATSTSNTPHIRNRVNGQILVNVSNVENYNITGTQYDDIFVGLSGNDIFNGGAGNDTFDSGAGNDILNPGYSQGSVDTVNGGDGTDTLEASYTNKTDGAGIHVGATSTSNTPHIRNRVNGQILVNVSNVENYNITGTQYDDIFVGLSGNDIFNGGAGNDTFDSGVGNDTLDGGSGNDILKGGAGNDVYVVDTTNDSVTENANEGIDTIQSSVTFSLANLPNVENLTLTGAAAINGTGNAANNVITGNASNNILNGDNSNIFEYNGSKYLLSNSGTWEQVQAQAQLLGANLVTINSQTEQDWLVSTFGGTEFFWIGLTDKVTESQFKWINGETLTYQNWSPGEPNNSGDEDYVGMNSSAGGKWNDFQSSTFLRGIIELKGNDTLIGGTGDDTYIVDSTTDVISENVGEGTDTIQSSVTFSLANLPNVENLTLTGAAAINGTGNVANNVITGNVGNNILDGGAGNDTLNGGDGNDILTGGVEKDTLTGGFGADRFDYRNLADSIFSSFDVITDFNATAGNDLFLIFNTRTEFVDVGSVATLDTAGIAAKLTTTSFASNSAAQFSFGSRTFVAINDATAGFNTNTDAIIEVTGFAGTLGISNFTTT